MEPVLRVPAPLVAIVGPTGVGKTRTGVRLALAFNGEIVSADSRQVYRHMNIGTAKPAPEELALVPHHLVDIVDPDQDFSLAEYQRLACQAIADIQKRGKLPFLVGGSGLYVWSVLEGWRIPAVPPDSGLRLDLEQRAAAGGAPALYDELVRMDPVAAQNIDPRNVRRVIRALEVNARSGQPFSSLQRKEAPALDMFIVGLTAPREHIYRLVDARVDDMVAQGLVTEVENLLKIGYDIKLSAMSGLGYRDIARSLKGDVTLEEAVRRIKMDNHRFIRHQYAWFRPADARIHWFDITISGFDAIQGAIAAHYGLARA